MHSNNEKTQAGAPKRGEKGREVGREKGSHWWCKRFIK